MTKPKSSSRGGSASARVQGLAARAARQAAFDQIKRSPAVQNLQALDPAGLASQAKSKAQEMVMSRVMQSPAVQNAVSGLAAAGIEITAETVEKALPDIQKAAAMSAKSGEAAAQNAFLGLVDIIPGVNDIAGVVEEAVAGADLVGSFAHAGTGIFSTLSDSLNVAAQKQQEIQARVNQLANAINEALPPPGGQGAAALARGTQSKSTVMSKGQPSRTVKKQTRKIQRGGGKKKRQRIKQTRRRAHRNAPI